ncbi:MAG: SPOR domain-containing protein [Planctomycetota bacterium]|jgi:tetratricopeptide (TPR) repeat protein
MYHKLFIPILIVLLALPLIASKSIDNRERMISNNVKLLVVKSPAASNRDMNNGTAGSDNQDADAAESNEVDYYNLGLVCENDGNYQEAIKAYSEAVRIKPDYKEAHYHLGLSYSMINDETYALNEYKILKNIDPDMGDQLYKEITEITSSDRKNRFAVQIGAYKIPHNADDIIEKLKADYLNAYIEKENNYNTVRIQGIKTRKAGDRVMKEILKKYNLKPFLRNAH